MYINLPWRPSNTKRGFVRAIFTCDIVTVGESKRKSDLWCIRLLNVYGHESCKTKMSKRIRQ